MKSRNAPFFFFFVSLQLMLSINGLHSQSLPDSSSYYYELALNPKNESSLVSAYNFFTKHKETCLKNNYIEGAIHDLSLLSIIQKESGYYHDSEASAIEAISLLEKVKETEFSLATRLTLYNELGKISRALKEYKRAMMYFDKAYAMAKRQEDFNIIRNNRAFIYMDQKKYEQALSEFDLTYKASLELKDTREIARNLDNLGHVQSKLKQPEALLNLTNALEIRLDLDDLEGIYASYKHLSDYYENRNEEQHALEYLNKSLEIANHLNSDSYKLDALSSLVDLSADSTVMTFKILSDKKKLENLLAANKYTSKKYDYTKKELEAQKSNIQKERYQMLGVIIVLISIFFFFLMKVRHKKDNIHQVFKTETRISKKIHDELANDVSDLINYVENTVHPSTESKVTLLNSLEDVYLRTRDISTEIASVDFINFTESLKHLLIQHNKQNVKVIINDLSIIDWNKISDHKKLAVYRVLQELMVNMKKYSQAQLVTIITKKNKSQNEIWYTDDGIGCIIEEIYKNGLLNAEFRIKEVGGTLTFDSTEGNGFKAKLIF